MQNRCSKLIIITLNFNNMKKLILSCITIVGSFSAFAQISIGKADLANPGDTLYYGGDTTNVTVNMAATAGANKTWDFSAAAKNTVDMAWFLDPSNSPVPAPSAITHVFIDGDVSNVTFMNATDSALYNIQPNPAYAFVGGEQFLGLKSLVFPLNYQDVSDDSIHSVSVIPGASIGLGTIADSVRVTISIKVNSMCDAWGSLKTPKTTYGSTLRIKNTINTFFKLEGKKSPLPFWVPIPVSALPVPIPAQQTEITYAWLGTGSKYFLAEANMATDSETERDVLRWQTDKPDVSNGLFSLVKNNVDVNAYPNPASSQVNLQFYLNSASQMDVSIYDVTGKNVIVSSEKCMAGTNLIPVNTSDLSAGLYTVIISGNGKSAAVKVNIIK